MTNILDGLQADVTATLAGTLRNATLWQYSLVDDGYGGQMPGYDAPYLCDGVRGSFESVLAGLSGIPRTDAKIELIAGTLAVEPKRLDKIHIEGTWWIITEIEVDPAKAVWLCQCEATEAVP
ncbi:MAG: hypothetical protein WBA88_22680 [Pseudaminobacter sp.]